MQESIQGLQLVDDPLREWLRVYLRTMARMDPWIITLGDRNVHSSTAVRSHCTP